MNTVYSTLIEEDPTLITSLRREVISVASRRIILRQGEVPSKLFTLYSGWAFRFNLLPDGRRQILSFLLPGDLVTTQAVYISPLRFSVQTVTEVTLCAFDAKELVATMQQNAALTDCIAARYAREVAEADDRVVGLGRRTAMERVSSLILKLVNKQRLRSLMRGDSGEFPLRQEHIADALGLTTVHVSRTISSLRDEGIIAMERNKITIKDRQRLIEFAGNNEAVALI
jgi:CRP-like cAMP-binding protein